MPGALSHIQLRWWRLLLAVAVPVLLSPSCVVERRPSWNEGTSTGVPGCRRAWHDGWDQLDVWGQVRLHYRQGPTDSVRIEGGDEELANFDLWQGGRCLHLNPRQPLVTMGDQSIVVHVQSPSLHQLWVNGNALVTLSDTVRSDTLQVTISGAGQLDLGHARARLIEVHVNGATSVRGAPRAELFTLAATGGCYADVCLDSCARTQATVTGASYMKLTGVTGLFGLNQSGFNNLDTNGLIVLGYQLDREGE